MRFEHLVCTRSFRTRGLYTTTCIPRLYTRLCTRVTDCHDLVYTPPCTRVTDCQVRGPTVTFTEVGAALRSREFSMETALPPFRTVTVCSGTSNVCFWRLADMPIAFGDARFSVLAA